ncbi:MAG: MerC family mercury resistance protein [Gemmatimonadaceae bacterium]|nr:MerC family mercury resistance protein [Gemmatimonadaceae bacterium]
MNRTGALSKFGGAAGVIAANLAALCCAGAPILVSVLTATGLSFLRSDAILLPIIAVALAIALVGFRTGRMIHGSNGPLALGTVGSVSLVAGVVFVHGLRATVLIGAAAVLLFVAMFRNATLPRACDLPAASARD